MTIAVSNSEIIKSARRITTNPSVVSVKALKFNRKRDYSKFINLYKQFEGEIPYNERVKFATKIFQITNNYDKVIFDYSWPSWNGEIPEHTSAVFQGLLRGTREIYEKCKELGRDFYYLDQPYFFMSSYKEHPAFNDRWYRIIKNN